MEPDETTVLDSVVSVKDQIWSRIDDHTAMKISEQVVRNLKQELSRLTWETLEYMLCDQVRLQLLLWNQ